MVRNKSVGALQKFQKRHDHPMQTLENGNFQNSAHDPISYSVSHNMRTIPRKQTQKPEILSRKSSMAPPITNKLADPAISMVDNPENNSPNNEIDNLFQKWQKPRSFTRLDAYDNNVENQIKRNNILLANLNNLRKKYGIEEDKIERWRSYSSTPALSQK